MVPGEQFDWAKEVLDDYFENIKDGPGDKQSEYSIADNIRMVIEAIVFIWFIPEKKWGKRKAKFNQKLE